MYRLPHALEPFPDESLLGLAMRNAAVYRFRKPERLFRRLHVEPLILTDMCRQDASSEVGMAITHLLGLDRDRSRELTIWHGATGVANVLGWGIKREFVRHRRRAVCPSCLVESQHHRAIWLVDIIPICGRHGCWLVHTCQTCGGKLGWNGVGVHRCRCRQDLRSAPFTAAPEQALGAVMALDAIFHRKAAPPLGMDFGQVLQAVLRLGLYAVGKEGMINHSRRMAGLADSHRELLPDMLAQGWGALADWPNGFHTCLDRVRSHEPPEAPVGLKRSFRGLNAWLFRWARAGWGKPLAEEFARYVATRQDVACTTHALSAYGSAKAIKRADLTMGEARRRLGVSPDTLTRIIKRNPGILLRNPAPGVPSLIKGSEVSRLGRLDARLLDVHGVAKLLGMSFHVIPDLEASGLIRRVPATEYVRENRSFRRSEIQGFLDRCMGNAPPVSAQEAKEQCLVTLEGASKPWRTRYEILAALSSGRLRAAASDPGKHGIRSIRLDMADVDAALPHAEALMTASTLCRELGVNATTLRVWRRASYIQDAGTTRLAGRKSTLLFSPTAIEAFRADYILGGELGELAGIGKHASTSVTHDLLRAGVRAVSGPSVDEAVSHLFLRRDVTPKVIEAARRLREKAPVLDQREAARSRTDAVLGQVAHMWGGKIVRRRNMLSFEDSGRTLFAVSGCQVSLVGRFVFTIHPATITKLKQAHDAWVAIIPAEGDLFLLVPFNRITWPPHRGSSEGKVKWLSIRFKPEVAPEWEEYGLRLVGDGQ